MAAITVTAELKEVANTNGLVYRVKCGARLCNAVLGHARRNGAEWIVTNVSRRPDNSGYSDYGGGGVYRAVRDAPPRRGYAEKTMSDYRQRETPFHPTLPATIVCDICERENKVPCPG